MEQRIVQDVNIGANLKKLRRRASMTQAEVAAKLELRGLYVSRETMLRSKVVASYQSQRSAGTQGDFSLLAMKKIFEIKTEL